jgi:hypothetical protein
MPNGKRPSTWADWKSLGLTPPWAGRKKAKLPTRVILPWLPPVPVRPPEWMAPIGRWYETSLRVKGRVTPYGARYHYVAKVPNWQWPPLPRQPVVGWRARLVAQYWRKRWAKKWGWVPRMALMRLWGIEKGEPFSVRLLRQLEWEWHEHARLKAKPQMQVQLGKGPVGLGWTR